MKCRTEKQYFLHHSSRTTSEMVSKIFFSADNCTFHLCVLDSRRDARKIKYNNPYHCDKIAINIRYWIW